MANTRNRAANNNAENNGENNNNNNNDANPPPLPPPTLEQVLAMQANAPDHGQFAAFLTSVTTTTTEG
jgi:hypothetical protein